jgi:DNA-binding transcriptional regulator YiaG
MQPEEFRQMRRQLGYTQAELAAALGTTQAAISRYEAGRRRIPQPVARLLDVIVAMRQGREPTMVDTQPAPNGRHAPAQCPGEGAR